LSNNQFYEIKWSDKRVGFIAIDMEDEDNELEPEYWNDTEICGNIYEEKE
jgi:hypothetical protein